ncbi:MAG TPA: double zinc ribbon domain-containing protein, partial [Thermoanaerobaculia bacterium]
MADPLYEPQAAGVTTPPARGLLNRLLHALLPAPCLGCGEPLPAAGAPLGLCGRCRAALARPPRQACAVCARPLAAHALPADYRCGACRQSPPAFDRLLALWRYQPPLDAVVRGLKFGRLDYLGSHLAAALAKGLG